jgi:hypothetical protein
MDIEDLDPSKLDESLKKKLEKLLKDKQELDAREQRLIKRATSPSRADRDRKNIVIGAIVQKLAKREEAVRLLYDESVLREVEENQRYLFPEQWPSAARPIKKAQAAPAAAPEEIQETTVSDASTWAADHDNEPRSKGNFGQDSYQQEDAKRQEAR